MRKLAAGFLATSIFLAGCGSSTNYYPSHHYHPGWVHAHGSSSGRPMICWLTSSGRLTQCRYTNSVSYRTSHRSIIHRVVTHIIHRRSHR